MIEPPKMEASLVPSLNSWEEALLQLVKSKTEYDQPEMYFLKDKLKAKYNQPYFPEKETDEQSVKNAIRILVDDKPVEISSLFDRLKPITQEPVGRVRYYLPKELHGEALKLRAGWR